MFVLSFAKNLLKTYFTLLLWGAVCRIVRGILNFVIRIYQQNVEKMICGYFTYALYILSSCCSFLKCMIFTNMTPVEGNKIE